MRPVFPDYLSVSYDYDVLNKAERCCDEIGVQFDSNDIVRVHHIGKPVLKSDQL